VEIVRVEIICPDRPDGNIVLEFAVILSSNRFSKILQKDEIQKKEYIIKEDSVFNLRIHFVVRNDIVCGLKFVNNVWKLGFKGKVLVLSNS
jgi:hypothetical protein